MIRLVKILANKLERSKVGTKFFFFYYEVLKKTGRDVKFIGKLFIYFFLFLIWKKNFCKLTEKCFQSPKQRVKRKTQFPVQQHETKKKQRKPQKYISVFNKPTGQQLLTPAICTWILVARNCLHLA